MSQKFEVSVDVEFVTDNSPNSESISATLNVHQFVTSKAVSPELKAVCAKLAKFAGDKTEDPVGSYLPFIVNFAKVAEDLHGRRYVTIQAVQNDLLKSMALRTYDKFRGFQFLFLEDGTKRPNPDVRWSTRCDYSLSEILDKFEISASPYAIFSFEGAEILTSLSRFREIVVAKDYGAYWDIYDKR